jgi:hypothetical protein
MIVDDTDAQTHTPSPFVRDRRKSQVRSVGVDVERLCRDTMEEDQLASRAKHDSEYMRSPIALW